MSACVYGERAGSCSDDEGSAVVLKKQRVRTVQACNTSMEAVTTACKSGDEPRVKVAVTTADISHFVDTYMVCIYINVYQ